AKSADDRFATCGELAQAARAALGGAPPSIVAAPVRVDEAAAAPPTEGPAPSTLPVDATPFVGREADAELLCERLARDDARMVTLSGPGGTGKTRLAVEVARRLEQLFPEGTFFIDLSPVFDPVAVEPRIAEALGVEEVSPGDVGAALRRPGARGPVGFRADRRQSRRRRGRLRRRGRPAARDRARCGVDEAPDSERGARSVRATPGAPHRRRSRSSVAAPDAARRD